MSDNIYEIQVGEFGIGQHKETGEPMIMFEKEWRPFREWLREEINWEVGDP